MKARTPIVAVAVVALGLAAWLGWRQFTAVEAPVAPAPVATPAPEPVPVPEPAPPAIQHPLEASGEPPPEPAGLAASVEALVGTDKAARFLLLDDLAHRIVATVDNLGRSHAAPALWPVVPSPGRFIVDTHEGVTSISTRNAERYGALVAFAESIDIDRAVALYQRLYPLLQASYRELGYPKAYFNDRVVEVVDLLLATPEPATPPQVQLTEVKGPVSSTRPWVHYTFTDPTLEDLSSGQRILLRVGPDHEKRLKQVLRNLRTRIARTPQ